MFRKSFFAISILAALVAGGHAWADTEIDGDLEIEVEVGDVTTEAAFLGDAETDLGTINDNSEIDGDAEIYLEAGDVSTQAAFLGDACTSVASVGGCTNQ